MRFYRVGYGQAGTLKKFHLREGRVQPPESVLLWHTVNVSAMVKGIDKAVVRMCGSKPKAG